MIDPRNYIPGCASYTKASEISSLQKYLKKGIKKRDEALELPENPEELNKDPLVPGIKELPKGAVGLHDPREVTELPDHSLKIVNPREESLEVHREDIQGAETPGLLETAIGLTDNREPALESRREDINVPEVDSLEDHREGITNEHDITELPGTRLNINQTLTPELSETRLDINESFTPELPEETLKTPGELKEPESLESTRLGLEGDLKQPGALEGTKLETPGSETSHEITNLPDSVIEGPKTLDVSLVDHRENIESNEDPGSLEDHRENISDERNVSLENHKESVEDHRKVTLEDHRENLEDERNVVLEDHRENLEDKRNPKLGTHRNVLEDSRNVSLEDHKDVLEDKRDPSLETRREVLEDKRSPKLETKKDIIEDKRNVDLDDTQLKTPGKQKAPELSGTVISGPEVKEVGLEKSKVSLENKRGVTLETHREDITDKRNPKLETRREDITDKRNPELPGTIIGLTDKRDISLGDHKETIEDLRNPELSGVRENIKVTEVPELSMGSVELKIDRDVSLEDHQEKITNTQDISELPGSSENMPGEAPEIILPGNTDGIPGEIKESELNIARVIRPGTDQDVTLPVDADKLEGTANIDSLETERLDIKNNREVILPEDRPGLTNDKNVSLPDSAIPVEGEVQEVASLEDTKLNRPGETPDINQIYSDTEGKELYSLEGLEVDLPGTRLDITNPYEPFLEDERLPMEPDMSDPGWDGSLEDEQIKATPDKNPEGWDGTLVTVEDIVAEPEDNWTVEADKNPVGWDESLITIDDIKAEPEDNWTIEADKNPEGWDETLVTVEDIKAEPEDNWTREPDLNPEGWDGELVTKEDIISEPEDNWTIEPDKNPEGWDETLVTVEDIKSEPEDNWTVEPDLNLEGWDGTLVTVEDIKAEPEDNWTVEADLNPEGWDGELVTKEDIKAEPEDNWTIEPDLNPEKPGKSTDINVILGLETEVVKIMPHINETTIDPDHAQKLVDASQKHSFKRDSDGVSSSIESEFSGEAVMSLKEYGQETKDPKKMDSSHPNESTPNPWETGTDLNYIDTREESDLKEYGKDTEKPVYRPDYKNPKQPENPDWKHVEVSGMSQSDFGEYAKNSVEKAEYKAGTPIDPDHAQKFVDTSQNHSFKKDQDGVSSSIQSEFSKGTIVGLEEYGKETEKPKARPKESNTGTYVSTTDGSQLSGYGAKTAVAESMAPDVVAGDLRKAFNWSEDNMGRSGWHVDDLAIPAYKLGGSFTSFLNPSKYLRFAVEKTVGAIPLKGSLKQWILNEALAGLIAARDKLEESLNLQPYRLPGSNEYAIQLLRQSMSGVDLSDAKNLVGNVASNLLSTEAVVIKNPINRPGKEEKYDPDKMTSYETKDGFNGSDYDAVANVVEKKAKNTSQKILDTVTKALGSNQGLGYYYPVYTITEGINFGKTSFGLDGTLSNLSNVTSGEISCFADLKKALEESPYITSSSKLYGEKSGDIHRHDNLITLDSNHVWEIVLEPYLGIENGNRSYLPSIQQINFENSYGFGLNTNWDHWIPFTSFELNSKKMVQKNLNLYSGEISIPQNLEFTNELRLVICDDQYKSWKRYFNYVMNASTYLCESHDESYYKKKKIKIMGSEIFSDFKPKDIQTYYKGVIRPAPYKNLAFRCKILSMNPQYQTVNISDLLVVLKDFTEEWQGEIDASPTELALMFSVVGENPKGSGGSKKPEIDDGVIKATKKEFESYAESMSNGTAIHY